MVGDSHSDRATWILCAIAVTFGLWAMHVGWHHSIFDLHGFRQSQTAWTAYWLAAGGPFLRYQTPIFGPPWSAPFELPLFQWVVASMTKLLGTALEPTGRAVSVGFFLATLVPLWFALDIMRVAPRHRPVFLALLVASPLYIFWSRTFMIESTALFFSVTYLAALHKAIETDGGLRRIVYLLVAALAASAAGTIKATTLLPFGVAGAALVGARWLRSPPKAAAAAAIVVLAAAVPAAATIVWTGFADEVKAAGPMTAPLASPSPAVRLHNYGTWQERLTVGFWNRTVLRAIRGATRHTAVGSAAVFGLALVSTLLRPSRFGLSAILLALYVLPIAIFARLYSDHVYYSYASGIFLIAIVGSGIVTWLERADRARWAGVVLFAAALAAMTTSYLTGYFKDQSQNHDEVLPLAAALRDATQPDDVLLLYGLDYSSEAPYAAKRRAIMDWQNLGTGHPTIDRTIAALGNDRIGAMAACGDARNLPIIRSNSARLGLSLAPGLRIGACDVYTR